MVLPIPNLEYQIPNPKSWISLDQSEKNSLVLFQVKESLKIGHKNSWKIFSLKNFNELAHCDMPTSSRARCLVKVSFEVDVNLSYK